MVAILLILSIISIVLGHLFKVYRWKQMVEIYEKTKDENLIDTLSIGYFVNYLLPYRIGDIVRAILSGKKMKNGISFSFATVILDRIMDVIVVAIIFIIYYIIGNNSAILRDSMLFYIIFAIALIVILAISLNYNKYMKMAIKKIAGIFNEKIELSILKLTWSFIQSFKDLVHNLNKIKILLSTVFMWVFYLISYALFALSINETGKYINTIDIFMSFFSKNNLDLTTYTAIQDYMLEYTNITLLYIIVPIILLLIIAFIISKFRKEETLEEDHIELLPHINPKDKLTFLEAYFSGGQKEYFRNYIKINRDVTILQDFSAGSNATTLLCQYKDKTIFRKYSIGTDSQKLYEQILWIEKHKKLLPLANILKYSYEDGACFYDMEYVPEAITCFNYIHSKPIGESWSILENVLNDLDEKLYKENTIPASKELTDKYIQTKVINNLNIIEKSKGIKELLKYDTIIINGKEYNNLQSYKKYLTYEYLYEIFKNDTYSDIHGDLTIENIICMPNNKYYLIDPNTGNVHDSANLDYAKLLQSLHGCYEFLMNIKDIDINNNVINYLNTQSLSYENMYLKYNSYLEHKFTKQQIKSIYFHEIVHWLRLLPYKIKKDDRSGILFYCGFIIVLNDIINKFEEDN